MQKRKFQKKRKQNRKWVLGQNLLGVLLVLAFFWCFGGNLGRTMVLSETIPFFQSSGMEQTECKVFAWQDDAEEDAEDTSEHDPESDEMIGLDEIIFQPEYEEIQLGDNFSLDNVSEALLTKLEDFNFLKQNYFLVDARTQLYPEDVPVRTLLKKDFTIDTTKKGPKILIFHTHSMEGFADSGDTIAHMEEGVWGAGEYLKDILENEYGIETLHDAGRYDMVGNQGQRMGAYERMEPSIEKVLQDNPSIQVVIDLHRDGLPEEVHLVSTVNGKKCAKIMFCNGLCRLTKDGVTQQIAELPNPNLQDNLAFSLQLKLLLNSMSPDLTRRTYINAYRYSTHMKPRSILVEVGSQMNTKEEAWNSMVPLAKAISEAVK